MRRPGPSTIHSLCSVGKRSLAQLLSHSCSRHLSCHLDWPPRPVCWFSDFTIAYLLCGMSSVKPLQPNIHLKSCFFKTKLVVIYMFLIQWLDVLRRCFATYDWFSWPGFWCLFEPTLREFWGNAFLCFIGNRCRGEHFFLWAEPFGVSKNSAVWTVGQLFCPWRLK